MTITPTRLTCADVTETIAARAAEVGAGVTASKGTTILQPIQKMDVVTEAKNAGLLPSATRSGSS